MLMIVGLCGQVVSESVLPPYGCRGLAMARPQLSKPRCPQVCPSQLLDPSKVLLSVTQVCQFICIVSHFSCGNSDDGGSSSDNDDLRRALVLSLEEASISNKKPRTPLHDSEPARKHTPLHKAENPSNTQSASPLDTEDISVFRPKSKGYVNTKHCDLCSIERCKNIRCNYNTL